MPTPPPSLSRRRFFLKSAGVTMSLPFMQSLSSSLLGAGNALGASGSKTGSPQRMVAIGNLLGFYQPEFFPKAGGTNYEMPRLLKPLAPYRKDFTLFGGLDHDLTGGHFAIHSFLSGVLSADAKSRPDGNISLDQLAAESVGTETRFPSLTIGSETGIHGGCQMCWTRSGTRVPPIPGPRELFRRLFISDSADSLAKTRDRFHLKGSILDAVHGDAKSIGRTLDQHDREKLDEYFTSVREVERRLELGKHWAAVPKPDAPIVEPKNTNMVEDLPLLYDLIALALQTDSTRIATLEIGGDFEARYFDIKSGYHALSHHGKLEDKIKDLLVLEEYQMQQFARFLAKLKATPDGEATLLDHTSVLFGSGMANANAHTNKNLPIILAGGGFKHEGYRAISRKGLNRRPLGNLYVSMLQRFGLEIESFGNSTGSLLSV